MSWGSERAAFEADGVILGHRALLLEAQRLFDLF